MVKSVGTLHYNLDVSTDHQLVVKVDQGIVDVARALVPKHIRLNRQKYEPHITVIRKEVPQHGPWGLHHDKPVEFEFDSYVFNDDTYFWLRAFSPQLIEIRKELGLPDYSWAARGPDGFDSFHITIGNTKS